MITDSRKVVLTASLAFRLCPVVSPSWKEDEDVGQLDFGYANIIRAVLVAENRAQGSRRSGSRAWLGATIEARSGAPHRSALTPNGERGQVNATVDSVWLGESEVYPVCVELLGHVLAPEPQDEVPIPDPRHSTVAPILNHAGQ